MHDSDQNGSDCSSSSLGCHSGGAWNLGERIEIRLKNSIGYMNSDDLYGTTVHELAHSAHLENTRVATYVWDWDDVETKVRESYAVGVEWWLTKKRYDGYVPSYPIVPTATRREYTGIMKDLVDEDTLLAHGRFKPTFFDRITRFTVGQISEAFMGSVSFKGIRKHIVSLAQNEIDVIKSQTSSQINAYINDYNRYGFDSYNQSLFTNLKNRLLEEEKYIDSVLVYALVPDDLVGQIEFIYINYFLNMNALFNYWRDLE